MNQKDFKIGMEIKIQEDEIWIVHSIPESEPTKVLIREKKDGCLIPIYAVEISEVEKYLKG